MLENPTDYIYQLGFYQDISVFVRLDSRIKDCEDTINLVDLPTATKEQIKELSERKSKSKNTMSKWLSDIITDSFEISLQDYFSLIALKETRQNQFNTLLSRNLDLPKYLQQLLQSYSMNDLKELCKELEVSGFSRFAKQDLIEYMILNLSEEEQVSFLLDYESKIINCEIKKAIEILQGRSREKIISFQIRNGKEREISVEFEATDFKTKKVLWSTSTATIFNEEKLEKSFRDCTCTTGNKSGFCAHFWVTFMMALKNQILDLSQWRVTVLPSNFELVFKNTYQLIP